MEMDVDEPSDTMVIKHAIGYAVLMGMGLLSEINARQMSVSALLLINYIMGLMTLVIVAHFCYKGAGVV